MKTLKKILASLVTLSFVLFMLPTPTYAAMTFVQGVSADGAAGSSPQALPALTSIAAGDLIVVLCGGDGGLTGLCTSMSDTFGNTYTRVPATFDIANGGGTLNLDAFYAVVTAGHTGSNDVISIVFNSASENVVGVAQQFNGFTGTATLDQKKTTSNTTSTTCTSGATGVTTAATELVVGLCIHDSTVSAFSLGSGYTNLTQVSVAARQAAMESQVVSSTGAQTATMTIAASRVNIGGVITFSDSGGGGGGGGTTNTNHTSAIILKASVIITSSKVTVL